jgi:glycosyltransferase involved in cell wall biosynthesis
MGIVKAFAISILGKSRLRGARKLYGDWKEQGFDVLAACGAAPEHKRCMAQREALFAGNPADRVMSGKLDIAFIVPAPFPGSGGQRVTYRIIRDLRDAGNVLSVYVIDTADTAATLRRKASKLYYDMADVDFIRYAGAFARHDICFATFWKTAWALDVHRDAVSRPCYLVQDYEPLFYPMGSDYVLAGGTYRLGFMHVCLGPWCAGMLRRRHNVDASFVPFPLDTSVYNVDFAKRSNSGRLLFFARPEMEHRCFQIGCEALRHFAELAPDVEITFFGSQHVSRRDVPFAHRNLGLVRDPAELAELYRSAGLGLAFSPTNPSLVGYEMLACGCPVADLSMEDALDKYGGAENNVFLLDSVPRRMGIQLSEIWNNPEERIVRAKNGNAFVSECLDSEHTLAGNIEKLVVSHSS